MDNPLIILELNEFSDELLKAAIEAHSLTNLKAIFEYKRSLYKTNDRYNSGYLEPWVQWTSIHTGVPAKQHAIKHLGDLPKLKHPYIWDKLKDEGIQCLAMTAPWLEHTSKIKAFTQTVGLFFKGFRKELLAARREKRKALKQFGKAAFVELAYIEYIKTLNFVAAFKKEQPKVSFLHLNLLAHLQKHYWKNSDKIDALELSFGLKMLDNIVGLLLNASLDLTFVMHNGLSQMNTNHEKQHYFYQPKDAYQFLIAMNLRFLEIKQHEGVWELLFTCDDHCIAAYDTFKAAKIGALSLFQVEKDALNKKIYAKINVADAILPDTTFEWRGETHLFSQYFSKTGMRTGRLIPLGNIYSNKIDFPDHIFNHDFNRYLLNYISPEKYPLPARESRFSFELEEA